MNKSNVCKHRAYCIFYADVPFPRHHRNNFYTHKMRLFNSVCLFYRNRLIFGKNHTPVDSLRKIHHLMKNILTLCAAALLIFCTASSLSAQEFQQRVNGFSKKKTSYITKTDGKVLEGEIDGFKWKKGLPKLVKFEVSGKKMEIPADEVESMKAAPSGWGRMNAALESTTNLKKLQNADYEEVDRNFSYYEQAGLPTRKGHTVLLQLVNPGFDAKLKVYDDPYSKETAGIGVGGMTMAGGILKSYWVKKAGEKEAFKVEKGKYKKQFKELYGDCPKLMKMLKNKEVKWSEFAKHVYIYTFECE